jgi:SAM-dependent methyltransferase
MRGNVGVRGQNYQGNQQMSQIPADVAHHYGRGGLLGRLLTALAQAGKDIDRLTIDDLAPVDEFHSRRRLATDELARLLAPSAADHVVDIGSGIGGPSRYLAATYGCRVSGVDLTPEFVATAEDLTRRVGLPDRVDFRVGSALDLPFPDASFDLAWTQNVAMNIADRPRFYGEIHRVLKPNGRLAIQDVAQGSGGAVHFPVAWADTPDISFLRSPEETRAMLEAAGFVARVWEDNTQSAIAEFEAERAHAAANPGVRPALGVHLVVGESFREKMRNSQRSLAEGRTRLINAVLVRANSN